jgi:hypothetical protein
MQNSAGKNVMGSIVWHFKLQHAINMEPSIKCVRNQGLRNGDANSMGVSNELVFTGYNSTVLDGSTVLPDNGFDGREESKMMQG